MIELKKCPFCGGEATVGANEYYDGANTFYIYCTSCGVQQMTTKIRTDEAIAAWNRRAKPENEPLTLSELYDIDSEPLYFHCMVGHWSLNGWHIVKAINYDGAQFKDVQLDNNDAHIESLYNYGITWLAYRAKPERSEGE
jgi:Lar family restriction alleviation protein